MKLKINEAQQVVLINALDFYSRIGIGQLEEVLRIWPVDSLEQRVRVEALLGLLKKDLIGISLNADYSILSDKVSDRYRIAYDIMQVLRGPGPSGFLSPERTSKAQELPTIEED